LRSYDLFSRPPAIGALLSIPPFVLLVAGPVWSGIADASHRHRLLMTAAISGAAIFGLLVSTTRAMLEQPSQIATISSLEEEAMRIMLNILGAFLVVMGGFWLLQGVRIINVGAMAGHRRCYSLRGGPSEGSKSGSQTVAVAPSPSLLSSSMIPL